MISTFQVTTLAAIAADLLLGVLVFFTNPRRTANRLFLALSFVLAYWLYFQFGGAGATRAESFLHYVRQASAVGVGVPLLASMLRLSIQRPEAGVLAILRASALWLACAVAAALLAHLPGFADSCTLAAVPGELGVPHYGPLFAPYLLYWVLSAAALIVIFARGISRAQGLQRIEMEFMALASVLAIVPGVICILVVPLAANTMRTAVFGPFFVVIWLGTIAYGVATRRIMGVAEFLRRLITTALVGGFLSILYAILLRAAAAIPLPWSADVRTTASHVTAAVAVALLLSPAYTFLQLQADALFAPAGGGLPDLLRRGRRLALALATMDDLLSAFALLLRDTLSVESVRLYLRADDRFVLRHRQGEIAGPESLAADAPLPRALADADAPLVREALRRAAAAAAAEPALSEARAEAAVALRAKGELQGFLLLGQRRGGQVFGHRETDALLLLGDQLGTAIENALLYTRLQDAKHHNELLLDNLVTGVVATDTAGCVTVCNREALRILHAPAGNVIGRAADEALPAPLAAALRHNLSGSRSVRDVDAVLFRRTPSEQPVRYSTAVFSGHADAIMGVLLVLQDTSALRHLEEQVRRNDRLASLGTLAAGMAHEIKNPLVSLKTFAQLLPERYDDPEFRDTFGPLLGEEVGRIDLLVGQLLDFARPVKPDLAPTDLHGVVEAALQLVAQQIRSSGLALDRRFETPDDRVLGDERLLRQVFVNLLLNGIEAMEAGGTLTVGMRPVPRPAAAWRDGQESDAWVEAYVRDTGCGIAAADRVRIFDPFFTTKPGGTGLGLSVVHGIVWDHLGCIDVESEPGHGACFRVALPLQPRSAP
jgi:signal transduction histidine kinase/GAF domain-containing protein